MLNYNQRVYLPYFPQNLDVTNYQPCINVYQQGMFSSSILSAPTYWCQFSGRFIPPPCIFPYYIPTEVGNCSSDNTVNLEHSSSFNDFHEEFLGSKECLESGYLMSTPVSRVPSGTPTAYYPGVIAQEFKRCSSNRKGYFVPSKISPYDLFG